mmetsp:Transcript_16825/g.53814  ORF Transcript_16825/g.53814 Transcript_16825/m.53814 type:complete len:608 (+) Transcript_16825:2-1825(+)
MGVGPGWAPQGRGHGSGRGPVHALPGTGLQRKVNTLLDRQGRAAGSADSVSSDGDLSDVWGGAPPPRDSAVDALSGRSPMQQLESSSDTSPKRRGGGGVEGEARPAVVNPARTATAAVTTAAAAAAAAEVQRAREQMAEETAAMAAAHVEAAVEARVRNATAALAAAVEARLEVAIAELTRHANEAAAAAASEVAAEAAAAAAATAAAASPKPRAEASESTLDGEALPSLAELTHNLEGLRQELLLVQQRRVGEAEALAAEVREQVTGDMQARLAEAREEAEALEAAVGVKLGRVEAAAEEARALAERAAAAAKSAATSHAAENEELRAAALALTQRDVMSEVEGLITDGLASMREELVAQVMEKVAAAQQEQQQERGSAAREASQASAGITLEEVKALVAAELERFAADKTGLMDLAAISAGAEVVLLPQMTSPTYEVPPNNAWERALELIRPQRKSPEVALDEESSLGKCWAFPGRSGRLTVRLVTPACVGAVSVEHVPAAVSPLRASAPKTFELWGFDRVPGGRAAALRPESAPFMYDIHSGHHVQTFKVERMVDERGRCVPLAAVQLRITDNWGQEDYTCLYRFRVHPAQDVQTRTAAAAGAA